MRATNKSKPSKGRTTWDKWKENKFYYPRLGKKRGPGEESQKGYLAMIGGKRNTVQDKWSESGPMKGLVEAYRCLLGT